MAARFKVSQTTLHVQAYGQEWVFPFAAISGFYFDEMKGIEGARLALLVVGGPRIRHDARLFIKSAREEMHLPVDDSKRVRQVVRLLQRRCPAADLGHLDDNEALEQFGAYTLERGFTMSFTLVAAILLPGLLLIPLVMLLKNCQ